MRPRRAGEFALRRFRIRVWLWVAVIAFGALAAIAVSALFGRFSWRSVLSFVLVSAVVFWRWPSITEDRKDDWAWYKGGRGEQAVSSILRSLEPEGYVVLDDVPKKQGNIDHVVLGPTGAFIVETKAVTGRPWAGAGGRLMVGKFDRARWVGQATGEAMEIRRRLKAVGIDVWVETLIALPSSTLPRGSMQFRHVEILEAANVPGRIRQPRRGLTPEQIIRATAAILRGDDKVSVRSISMEG